MANIDLYSVFESSVRKFNVGDSVTYRESFVDAVNNVLAEFNSMIFRTDSLSYIDSFDDIIDSRLYSFTSLTNDDDSIAVMSNREIFDIEHTIERTELSNGFTDTITDDVGTIVLSILDSVLTITTDGVVGSVTLPEDNILKIKFSSYETGNKLTINDEDSDLTYTTGDETSTISIGDVSSRVINGVAGYEIMRTRFMSSGAIIYWFDLSDGETPLEDKIAGYDLVAVGAKWADIYRTDSTELSDRFLSEFRTGVEYHLQESGRWALEDKSERERKWYGRAIPSARYINQQMTTYVGPLGAL